MGVFLMMGVVLIICEEADEINDCSAVLETDVDFLIDSMDVSGVT